MTESAVCLQAADFFTAFAKIYSKKVVLLIDIFITLFSNRHVIKWQRSVI